MKDEELINKMKELVSEGNLLKTKLIRKQTINHRPEFSNSRHYKECEKWRNQCSNILKLRFGQNSDYYENFEGSMEETIAGAGDYSKENFGKALGVFESVLDALESGLTEDLFYQREILIFSNLLEQAYEFLKNDLREVSAIYGRIVLETTIKEFAFKKNINEKSFDQMIIKLRQGGFIHQPLENSLRANYQIGSDATHNNEEFKKYSNTEIKEFLNFVRDKILTLE